MDERGSMLIREVHSRRIWRVPMYFLLMMGGIFSLVSPSQLVTEQTSATVAFLWSCGMVFSASVCLYGSATDRWIGEYTGLPLLASVLALFGGSAVLSVNDEGYIILAWGLTMIAFGCGLMARWLDVRTIKLNATPREG